MKKKVLTNRKKEVLLFAERLLAVFLAVSVTLIFINSFFTISTSYGTTYHYIVSPFDQNQAFEERDIFHALLNGNMEQITRYVVIRNQMETNGVYDANKKVEITRYANRSTGEVEGLPTAQYYLDDLITWGNYGFTYKTVEGTWDELNAMFGEKKGESQLLQQTEMAGGEEIAEEAEDPKYSMEILVPRYKTVDGRDLTQCAANVEEYEILKHNLEASAKELFSNYTEYVAMQQQYLAQNTNIGYCFRLPSEQGLLYYTNSDLQFQGLSTDDITALVKEQGGRFIYFNPDKVQINTNTDISAREMRSMLKEHEYTFGDDTRVWIWVNVDYPAKDSLQVVKNELSAFYPYFVTLSGCTILALLLWLFLVGFLIRREGRKLEENGEVIQVLLKQDKLPLEVWTLLVLICESVLLRYAWQMFVGYKNGTVNYVVMPIAIGILVFLMNEIGIRYLFSMTRRIKAKRVWKSTLIYKLMKDVYRLGIQTIQHGGIVSRIWIPYLIFLMINLILVLLGVGGVIGAFLLDMLVGAYLYRESKQREEIMEGMERIKNGESKYRIDTIQLRGENRRLAESVNSIGNGIRNAVESSMKDEKLKTDLITNVSHDIKTPLTSIITYVDLLKREKISDERIRGYIEILDSKSQRLKQLIDDLVEASKISSGNIKLQLETINLVELVRQSIGEFEEKFDKCQLKVVTKLPDAPMFIEADSGQLWRVMENLFENVSKYAMQDTRVYIEIEEEQTLKECQYVFSVKNISAKYLEVEASDLTERFIRGDQSRQTEGSGLGLSIAKNLIEAQNGEFEIQVDGDLFKAMIKFPAVRVSS